MTFEETVKLDQTLLQLAAYDISHGCLLPTDQEQIAAHFRELKMRIRRGSFTVEGLAKRIIEKWGISVEQCYTPETLKALRTQRAEAAVDKQLKDQQLKDDIAWLKNRNKYFPPSNSDNQK